MAIKNPAHSPINKPARQQPRPEPQTPTRTASDEVLEEVRALSGVHIAEDGVMREIERMTFSAAPANSTTTPTQASTSVASDDALEAIKQLGASDDAIDEVAALAKGGA